MVPIEEGVFLSDVELDLDKKDRLSTFQHFLINIKNINKTPIILGDFFEYYPGKEILKNYLFQQLLSFLKNENIKIYLIPGNRESLIKSEIEFEKNNFYILNKNVEISKNGYNILLTHGDEILEQEVSHILFKKTLSFVKEKNIDEKVPGYFKNFIGTILRRLSRGNSKKSNNTINTNNFHLLTKYNIVIMGHFTEQKEICIKFDHKITKVYILGKWEPQKPVLIYDDGFKWIAP